MKNAYVCAFAALLFGCMTDSNMPLAKNVWQVNVDSSGSLFVGKASSTATLKAAELTLKQGYTKFVIVNPQQAVGSTYIGSTPSTAHTNLSILGNTAYGTTTYSPGVPMFSTEKHITITVVMYHEGEPGSGNALDAAAIIAASKKS